MQFKNFFHLLFLGLLFFIFPNFSAAQQIEYNRHGERIVKFQTGKWEYYDESKPLHRAIWKEFQKDNNIENEEIVADEHTAKGLDDSELAFEILIEEAEEKLAMAESEEGDAKLSKILLEEELDDIKNNENSSSTQYKEVKKQLKLAAKLEKKAKKKRKDAEKRLKKLKKNGGEEVKGKKSKFAKSKRKKNRKSKKEAKEHLENQAIQNSTFAYQEDATFHAAAKGFKKYAVEKDVMYNPPQTDCNLTFDGVDEFLGKKRKDVKRDLFFTHTEDDMRRYMKDDEYIICEGSLTQIHGGVLLFNLFVSISTNDAKRSFGELKKGSLIVIKMIDGTKVTLANNQADSGNYDALTRKHTYTAQYMVNSGQEKKLKNGEVDIVRVIWETGYEDYEVYNLDFFRNQFRCLNK